MLLFILVRSFIQTDDRTAVWLAVVFRYRAEPTRTLPETYFILGSGRWLAYNFLPQPAWQSRLFHSINTRPWRPVDRTEYRSGIWDYLSDCRAGVRWFTALMCLSEPRFYFEIRFWWYLGKFWPGWWRARESTWLCLLHETVLKWWDTCDVMWLVFLDPHTVSRCCLVSLRERMDAWGTLRSRSLAELSLSLFPVCCEVKCWGEDGFSGKRTLTIMPASRVRCFQQQKISHAKIILRSKSTALASPVHRSVAHGFRL